MRHLLFIVCTAFFFSCSPTKYFVVRHAEKENVTAGTNMDASDPPLSAAGKVRAIELGEELKASGIRYIYSTNYIRTRTTTQPLSELRGITVQIYNVRTPYDSLVYKLDQLGKGNVLIVGHSNTVDDIVNALMGSKEVPGDLKDSDYDNLWIITKKGKKRSLEHKTYGTIAE